MRTAPNPENSTTRAYLERVNRAIDYIMTHLTETIRLEDVARSACLSSFHFHRVFQTVVGMTIAEFVKQRRLEKALAQMAHSKKSSLTSVAFDCGFASSSDFSRCFKQQFGVPPSVFDIDQWKQSHQHELESHLNSWPTDQRIEQWPVLNNDDGFQVRVRTLPARSVAYIRVTKPYQGGSVVQATKRLMAWADQHGYSDGQWLGYQWENPEIVPLDECYYCVAVEADEFQADGEIGRFEFPPMLVAEIEVKGDIELELKAFQWLYGAWLPDSAYVPDDYPCIEAWIGKPFAHGTSHFELYAMLPIQRAPKL